jgi:BASS family bile acid:Na+ symporter
MFNPKIFPPEMELGGMAIIAAWWGIWHIISGLTIAFFWSRKPVFA